MFLWKRFFVILVIAFSLYSCGEKKDLLLNFDAKTTFVNSYKFTNGIDYSNAEKYLEINSIDIDPNLVFEKINLSKKYNKYYVYVELNVPSETIFKIYYTTNGGDFNEQNTLRQPVKQGNNKFKLISTDTNFDGGLRLDPGEVPGKYTIKRFSVYGLEK
ncbi:MAG TPA: hypothetical protein PK771_06660 [Spirochaetota bacterium]|nr:hypothetical protein [Spirochaetota bacterium]